ncbi:hypothetical protein C4569_01120 [Candidatus Parcubacteria bacterium]|nr:MAG: hypothetical protein C4569_01120 [Candidatus Parcubacteria bacterium]
MKILQNGSTAKRSAVVVLFSIFAIALVVTAASTIGNNISTDGTLDVTGLSTFSRATSTSATTTEYLSVGVGFTTGIADFTGGDLMVSGNVAVGGNASTTGDLFVSGGTFDVTTSTGTTTMGIFVRDNDTATSTLSVGGGGNMSKGCLEMVSSSAYYYCIINGAGTGIQCGLGRCSD